MKHILPHFLKNPYVPFKTMFNELEPKLMGICAVNPLVGQVSATRLQMFATHLGQAPAIQGASEAFLQSGMERKFGAATFSIRADEDMLILKTLQLYPKQHGFGGISYNPEDYVIYEERLTGTIGIMTIPKFVSNHPYFGYRLKPFEAASKLYSDGAISAGEVIYDAPNRDQDGTYRIGREIMVAFMSHPAVADDGIGISDAVLPHYKFHTYEKRTVSFGSNSFPLNTYGDDTNYKICPDIGEYVREDGILMAVREYDDMLAGIEQSVFACQRIDDISDIPTYVDAGEGEWRGKVIDIRVLHDRTVTNSGVPLGMADQLIKYNDARLRFYEELMKTVAEIKATKRKNFVMTPALHSMMVDAEAATAVEANGRVQMLNSQKPLDTWDVSFVVEYTKIPGLAAKFTGLSGDKGVVVTIIPEKDMPLDSAGKRAEVIFDNGSTSNRQNPGRMDMHYINSYRDYLRDWLCAELGYKPGGNATAAKIKAFHHRNPDTYSQVWAKLMRFYDIVSPTMLLPFTLMPDLENDYAHLAYIISKNMYLQIPTNNQRESFDRCEMLEREFDRINGPVTYTGYSGVQCVTHDNVVIAHMNVMLLEKLGDDWSAVSSGRTQLHGILSQVTRADKYRYAVRLQPTRFIGETELRLLTANMGPVVSAELLDRNNNPQAHKAAVYCILHTLSPTNIRCLINRKLVPIDGSRPLKIIKHIVGIAGWGFAYKPYVNVHPRPGNYSQIGYVECTESA